jgi:cysteine desulfurase/selenocysteine lyase
MSAQRVASEAPAAPLDVEAIRQDFPILRQQVHGKPLVYLDSANTSQKPQAVIDAEARVYREIYANVHRGVYDLSVKAEKAFEAARHTVQRFLNAPEAREIVFLRGTTEAVNLVANTFGRQRVKPGDEILISGLEHHSNIVPWQLLCEQTGGVLKVAGITDEGEIRLDEMERLLSPRTRLVSVGHVSNALGTVNPVRQIVEMAHARGVPVLVDGAQGVPICPWTCRRSAATSTRSPATRRSGRPGSARCGAAPRCWSRCRRGTAAAT